MQHPAPARYDNRYDIARYSVAPGMKRHLRPSWRSRTTFTTFTAATPILMTAIPATAPHPNPIYTLFPPILNIILPVHLSHTYHLSYPNRLIPIHNIVIPYTASPPIQIDSFPYITHLPVHSILSHGTAFIYVEQLFQCTTALPMYNISELHLFSCVQHHKFAPRQPSTIRKRYAPWRLSASTPPVPDPSSKSASTTVFSSAP